MTTAPTATRAERLRWGAASAVVVLIGMFSIFAVDNRYFYLDDTESGAVGNWLALGRLLREGQFLPLVTTQWMGGNYPVEGQGGLWNPVQMIVNLLAPSFDDLALYSALVKIFFAVILALGVYRVALEYGARPAWAAAAGAAVPFSGFTLFFDQPSWVTSLIGMAWVMQAWASAERYVRGRSGPIPVFAFLYLAISVGYVHAAMMAGVTAGAVMIGHYIRTRSLGPVLRLAAASTAAAMCGAITFLPGALTSGVTWRTGVGVRNDNSLVAPWSETLSASLPSAITSMQSFGEETTPAPVTYIAWFVIPMLAFVRWRRVAESVREFAAPAILLVALLLFTAGPSDIGPLRWPARLLPFVACVLLVAVVVLISRFGTLRHLRGRITAAVILIAILLIRAMSSGPFLAGRHLLSVLFVVVAGALVLLLVRTRGAKPAAALLMVSVIPVALYQVISYDTVFQGPLLPGWQLPRYQSEAREQFPDRPGTTLQLGDREASLQNTDGPTERWEAQTYGNYAKILDLDYVNVYTPVGHRAFGDLVCAVFDGSTCRAAYDNVFAIEPTTGRTYVDLMLVDRVVLQIARYPAWQQLPVAAGWEWVDVPEPQADQIVVLERIDGPISAAPGTVSAVVDATAESVSVSEVNETVRVSSEAGGSVVFARLAWPGYTAALDGEAVPTAELDDIFLTVDVPPGTADAELEIVFRPPGFVPGLVAMGGGLIALALLTGLDIRDRRRRGDDSEPGVDATTARGASTDL